MEIRLFNREGDLVYTTTVAMDYPVEAVTWQNRYFIRDPWTVDPSDQWVRYSEISLLYV